MKLHKKFFRTFIKNVKYALRFYVKEKIKNAWLDVVLGHNLQCSINSADVNEIFVCGQMDDWFLESQLTMI